MKPTTFEVLNIIDKKKERAGRKRTGLAVCHWRKGVTTKVMEKSVYTLGV